MIKPVLTEKSLANAKLGKYTFAVPVALGKGSLKAMISDLFKVTVRRIWTLNAKRVEKRGINGKKKVESAGKKVIVQLKNNEKIDLFDIKEEKGK